MLQDHERVEARFLRGWNKANSRIPALDVRGTDFSLAWENAMGYHPRAKNGPRADWFSGIIPCKISPSLKAGNEAQAAGSLHG